MNNVQGFIKPTLSHSIAAGQRYVCLHSLVNIMEFLTYFNYKIKQIHNLTVALNVRPLFFQYYLYDVLDLPELIH